MESQLNRRNITQQPNDGDYAKGTTSRGALAVKVKPFEREEGDFFNAIRHRPILEEVLKKYPDFDPLKVPTISQEGCILWDIYGEAITESLHTDEPLEYIADRMLETAIRWNDERLPLYQRALDWHKKGTICKPSQAQKIAFNILEKWKRDVEDVFEFSTDNTLDALLGSVEWLWEGYIPCGFVTGLVAPQDEGKSTIAQDFCRTLLTGGRWPDGRTCAIHEGKLLWIDTDGNLALFHQRLKQWKMPRGRFLFPSDALQELTIDNPEHWKWIVRAIERFSPPVVVIDALSGSHSGKENDTDSMKAIMKRLHALAQKYKIAIIVIHHLNKAPFGVPTYPLTVDRLRGSSSISQFCRSILALTTPDPTSPTARRLDVIKLNLGKKPLSLGYVLTDDGPAWGDAPEPPKEHRVAADAIQFLREALANGQRPADEVLEEAKANGLTDYALRGAREALGIKPQKPKGIGTKNAPWTWGLPDLEGRQH